MVKQDILRKCISVSGVFLMLASLCSCGLDQDKEAVEKIDRFSGKTVGVVLSWDSDYALTPRKDIELQRYDAMPDMVMALQHDRIDAMALDEITAKSVIFMIQGIEIVQPGYGSFGYVAAFNPKYKDLCDDYDQFLSEYIKTEEYADLQRRIAEYDGIDFEERKIKPTGTGMTLRLACNEAGFPSTYLDPVSNEWAGFDYEPLITWANDRNYKIEITGTVSSDSMMGLSKGRYDVAIGYINELYEDDFNNFDIVHSIPINHLTNYFMVKTDEGISASDEFYDEYE